MDSQCPANKPTSVVTTAPAVGRTLKVPACVSHRPEQRCQDELVDVARGVSLRRHDARAETRDGEQCVHGPLPDKTEAGQRQLHSPACVQVHGGGDEVAPADQRERAAEMQLAPFVVRKIHQQEIQALQDQEALQDLAVHRPGWCQRIAVRVAHGQADRDPDCKQEPREDRVGETPSMPRCMIQRREGRRWRVVDEDHSQDHEPAQCIQRRVSTFQAPRDEPVKKSGGHLLMPARVPIDHDAPGDDRTAARD